MEKKRTHRTLTLLRRVNPPEPVLIPPQAPPANRVLSVLLRPGERVRWIWSVTPGGISYASGYEILKGGRVKSVKGKRP